ncbi:hypothetical protein [[Mycobacterium] holstebronense]|uniref:MarR family transcriptional regulator n=1 Tax=[Mycobacterium] holstebronense TaxID=3064288 RepID=A0ABM9LZF3_9MYCO|nr:hypothetical protein [Mycolicibacter sp. MU0102]CAJ1507374.1 hypothetical protein MU0102_003052 [Mycolicibacter sp. MU0102]
MENELVSIADAADALGIRLSALLSRMAADGLLLVVPGTEDPRCGNKGRDGVLYHRDDCDCGFTATPHPDIVEMDPS